MFTRTLALVFVLCFLVLLTACHSTHEAAKDVDPAIVADLRTNLAEFANKHSLDDQQLVRAIDAAVLDGQQQDVGGVGVIAPKTYVLLDKDQNIVDIKGRQLWKGANKKVPQVVVLDSAHVLASTDASDISKITLVVFTPTEVRFFSLASNAGGRYSRYETGK